MNIFNFLFFLLFDNKPNPSVRLGKVEEKSKFQAFCDAIAPYVIVFGIIVLAVLAFLILLRFGYALTGTEANGYYYHLENL